MVGKYFLIFLAACTFGHKPTDCCSCHSLAAAAFSAAATAASATVAASALLFFLLLKLFFQLSRCIAIETETEKALDFHRSPKVADDDDDDVVLAKVINLRSEWRAYHIRGPARAPPREAEGKREIEEPYKKGQRELSEQTI